MSKKLMIIFLSILCSLAALGVIFTSISAAKQKRKREEEELEHYLDSSIQ